VIRGILGFAAALLCLLPLGFGVLLGARVWAAFTPLLRLGVGLYAGIASAMVLLPPLLYLGLSPSLPVVLLLGIGAMAVGVTVHVARPMKVEQPIAMGVLPGFVLAIPLALLAIQAVDKPVDRYDAYANWILKAKLLLGGGLMTGALNHDAFGTASVAPPVSRQYPIGLPAIYDYFLRCIGGANVRIGHLFFVAFLLGFAVTIWVLLRPYVPALILLLGLSYVLWMPAIRVQTLSDYADVPMACLIVTASIAVGSWIAGRHVGWLALGSIFAAAALATKRDAVSFCAVLCIVAAAALIRRPRRLAVLGVAALGVILTALPWQVYVSTHGLVNRDVAFSFTRTVDHISAVPFVSRNLLSIGTNSIFLASVPLAFLAAMIALRHREQWRLSAGFIALLVGMIAALGFVYLNGIADIHYLLRTSGHRTFLTPALLSAALLPLLLSRALAPLDGRLDHGAV
jgi:hypothetical protein